MNIPSGNFATAEKEKPMILTLEALKTQVPEKIDSKQIWLLDSSKLWYLSEQQGEAYIALDSSKEYSTIMHDAETECIERNLKAILSYMEGQVSFLDLGCGEALKSIKIISNAMQQGISVDFYPVDINEVVLRKASSNASKVDIPVYPISGDFEKQLGEMLNKTGGKQRLINLGANLVNFDPDEILSMIASTMRENDLIYFSAQRLGDIDAILEGYSNKQFQDFAFGTMQNATFMERDAEFGSRFNHQKSRVEVYYTVKNVPEELADTTMKTGDEILVIKSLKFTLEEFEELCKTYFDGEILFNENKEYMAFIGKKKK